MSINVGDDGKAVHYPRNPNQFEFDFEVAEAFDDMATRSIPLYHEQHRLHSKMAIRYYQTYRFATPSPISVLDVGCSTGNFLLEFATQYHEDSSLPQELKLVALDPSFEMCTKCADKLEGYDLEIAVKDASYLSEFSRQFEIINLSYVYQFVPIHKRAGIFADLYRATRSGGLVFFSQKFTHCDNSFPSNLIDSVVQGLYVDFRLGNGYTMQEIEAKTNALKNSMWLQNDTDFVGQLGAAGFRVYPLTRWLSFGSYVALKP